MLNELHGGGAQALTRKQLRDALIAAEALRVGEARGEDTLPRIVPEYGSGSVLNRLHPRLRDALLASGVDRLYTHQEDAIAAGLAGANVVLQAPTASGKSLAFQVPMVNTLLESPSAKALLIYPMKALAFDQRQQLERLTASIGKQIRLLVV